MVCRPITTRTADSEQKEDERFASSPSKRSRCYARKNRGLGTSIVSSSAVSKSRSAVARCRSSRGPPTSIPSGSRCATARAPTATPHCTSVRAVSPGALQRLGVRRGDVVAMMAANTPEIYEAHFGVPLAGAILNTINTRLDADTIAYILDHGGARVLLTDTHLAPRGGRGAAAAGPARPDRRRHHRRPGGGRRRAARRPHVRRAARRRTARRVAAAGRRVGRALAQLHVGHQRPAEGRRLPPPRRVPDGARHRGGLGAAASRAVPVHGAAVPLQRLDARVGAHDHRRHGVPDPPGDRARDVRRHRRARHHAHGRCADRARHAGRRARRTSAGRCPAPCT